MQKVAIVLLADTETPGDMGRMANALMAVTEFKQAGDQVKLILDGAATKWVGQLSQPDHKYHNTFQQVRQTVSGVCSYCANAYGVADQVKAANLPLSDDFQGHPSFRDLVS